MSTTVAPAGPIEAAAAESAAKAPAAPPAPAPAAPAPAKEPVAAAPAQPPADKKFRNVLEDAPPAVPADAAAKAGDAPAQPVKEDGKTAPAEKAAEDLSTLKLPEGSLLSPALLDKTVALAKARGLSVDQARAMLESAEEAALTYAEQQQATHYRTVDGWVDHIKADPDMGGAKFVQTAKLAKSVVDRFGSQGLKDALNSTGLGNHPELVRMFSKIGSAMANDSLVVGNAAPAPKAPLRPEDILFGDTPVPKGPGEGQ